jgi:hypothetical protein
MRATIVRIKHQFPGGLRRIGSHYRLEFKTLSAT